MTKTEMLNMCETLTNDELVDLLESANRVLFRRNQERAEGFARKLNVETKNGTVSRALTVEAKVITNINRGCSGVIDALEQFPLVLGGEA